MAEPHALTRLIDGVKEANGWSDTDLVKIAASKGHVLSKSNISRYRGPLVSIKGEIIRALAAALGVAPSQVAMAAIESMGISLPQYETVSPEQAVNLDTTLSTRDRELVHAILGQVRATGHIHPVRSGGRSAVSHLQPAATPSATNSGRASADSNDDSVVEQVIAGALFTQYIEMSERADRQRGHQVLIDQAYATVGDPNPSISVEPELDDRLYARYIAARQSTPAQGGLPELHAATGLTEEQRLAAHRRYRRELSEMILFDGRTRTASPTSEALLHAARTAPPGHRKGQAEQGEAPDGDD